MRSVLALALAVLATPAYGEANTNAVGEALYRDRCAGCHERGVARTPDSAALRQMPVENIRSALTSGSMSAQGEALTTVQLDALTQFLTGAAATPEAPLPNFQCSGATDSLTDLSDPFSHPHWNGWGVDQAQHRFQPASMAQLAAEGVPKLKLKWSFGFPGVNRAYAQPAVVGGRLFVGSASGKVYSLDAKSGCIHWVFDADVRVRTAISIGKDARGWSAYFGDQRANAYSVDALSGKLLWKTHVDEHRTATITGAPAIYGTVLYVPVTSGEEVIGADPHYPCCSFRGSVAALDTSNGKLLWKGYTVPQEPKPIGKNQLGVTLWGPSGAGIWSSPTIDVKKRMIYVTTGDSYSDPPADTSDAFLAFRMDTGELAWSRQMTAGDAYTVACSYAAPGTSNCPKANGPDLDFGSSPILVDLPNGHRALIAGQKSGVVHAIDPDREGALLWQRRVGQGGTMGGVQWGSAVDEHNVFVAVSDVRTRPVPEGTAGAQSSVFGPNYQLDHKAGGGLYALNLETGEVAWHTPHPGCDDNPGCSPAQSAAVTAIPGVVFSGGLDGHLRAYSATTGEIVWDVDTKGEYRTVNGMTAHGGSLDGPGAVVVGGMVYVNSGYAFLGAIPGNVLLAFCVDGK
jgi:polyvinyl alcohol dehydrogenase (cytochrome)